MVWLPSHKGGRALHFRRRPLPVSACPIPVDPHPLLSLQASFVEIQYRHGRGYNGESSDEGVSQSVPQGLKASGLCPAGQWVTHAWSMLALVIDQTDRSYGQQRTGSFEVRALVGAWPVPYSIRSLSSSTARSTCRLFGVGKRWMAFTRAPSWGRAIVLFVSPSPSWIFFCKG